ncbi:MAG: sulfocyanin-like copper-binding protein [Actinomycetota bacterium]|nr:sulfocyanin-like copper-binding protein [Actinomycetota bacterium]
MSWTKILVPALALVVGAGAGAYGVALTDSHGASGSPSSSVGSEQPSVGSEQPSAGAGAHVGGGMMGGGVGMMGGGGMTGGGSKIANGAPGGLVPASRMEALATKARRTVDQRGSTLTYRSQHVTLVALGAPGSRPGMYWQLDGVDGPRGPTVSVPAGAIVTVDFADGDPGHPHGLELTTAAPPYPRMAMMAGRIAAAGAFIMPVPPPEGNLWYAVTISFHAPAAGTYYVICPVPGHAQKGMWAKLVVR